MYDELVKRLWECASGECFNCLQYTETTNAIVCSKELMKQAADAIEELSKPRWIPVTERLPERNGTYLVYVYGDVTDLNYWRGKWHRLGDDYTKAVTHWMPLPQPPEEET